MECISRNFNYDVVIFSDSSYSINGISKITLGLPVGKNSDILSDILVALKMCNFRIEIKWVKGHA